MAHVMFSLAGRRALVTGGASGIGSAIARAFADAGAQVAIAGDRADELRDTADQIGAIALPCMLGTRKAAETLVSQAHAKLGPVDILVSNAGIEGPVTGIADLDEAT